MPLPEIYLRVLSNIYSWLCVLRRNVKALIERSARNYESSCALADSQVQHELRQTEPRHEDRRPIAIVEFEFAYSSPLTV